MARESVDSRDVLSRVVERYVMGVIEEVMLFSLIRGSHCYNHESWTHKKLVLPKVIPNWQIYSKNIQ